MAKIFINLKAFLSITQNSETVKVSESHTHTNHEEKKGPASKEAHNACTRLTVVKRSEAGVVRWK